MLVTIKRTELKNALATVGHAVSGKSTLPVLANVLIETADEHLILKTTNLVIGLTVRVAATITEAGTTTVPARILTDFVNALGAGDIELGPLPGGLQGVRVRSGSHEANIRGMDPSEFPAVPTLAEDATGIVLDAAALAEVIKQTTIAAATDDARPIFTGIMTRIRDGRLVLAAADTFRLAVSTQAIAATPDLADTLIPATTFNDLAHILPAEGSVTLYLTEARNQAIFRTSDGVEMVSHIIDGQFPNYEAIVPKSFGTRVVVPTDKLRAAAKIASLFAKNDSSSHTVNVVVTNADGLGLMPGTVSLSGNNDETGDASSTVDATIDGPDVTILLNSKYLLDVLAVMTTPEVVLKLNSSMTPGVIEPMSGAAQVEGLVPYTYVIMPLYSH